MSDNVVPFRGGLSRAAAERRIREMMSDTSSLIFPWSVAKRMAAGGISIRQVIATLRSGAVVENPMRNENGDWVCILRKKVGGLQIDVVAALPENGPLALIEVR